MNSSVSSNIINAMLPSPSTPPKAIMETIALEANATKARVDSSVLVSPDGSTTSESLKRSASREPGERINSKRTTTSINGTPSKRDNVSALTTPTPKAKELIPLENIDWTDAVAFKDAGIKALLNSGDQITGRETDEDLIAAILNKRSNDELKNEVIRMTPVNKVPTKKKELLSTLKKHLLSLVRVGEEGIGEENVEETR